MEEENQEKQSRYGEMWRWKGYDWRRWDILQHMGKENSIFGLSKSVDAQKKWLN